MINQLLVFRFTNNILNSIILTSFLPTSIDSILYANTNSFLVSYIIFYLLCHTHSMIPETPKTCNKKWYKTKTGRRKNGVQFPSKSPIGMSRIQMPLFEPKLIILCFCLPIVNMSTCPIPSFLLFQSLCCFHVPLTSNLV
jgi:hypothetical protein